MGSYISWTKPIFCNSEAAHYYYIFGLLLSLFMSTLTVINYHSSWFYGQTLIAPKIMCLEVIWDYVKKKKNYRLPATIKFLQKVMRMNHATGLSPWKFIQDSEF